MNNTEATERFKKAQETTKQFMPDYYGKVLAQRLYTSGAGSRVNCDNADTLDQMLSNAEWSDITDELDPALKMDGCIYLATEDVPGWNGMIPLDELNDNETLEFVDPKDTGKLSLAVTRNGDVYPKCLPYEDKTVAILGPTVEILGPEDGHEVLYTFHPGMPLAPSTFEVGTHEDGIDYQDGTKISVADAKNLGFKHAKLILE